MKQTLTSYMKHLMGRDKTCLADIASNLSEKEEDCMGFSVGRMQRLKVNVKEVSNGYATVECCDCGTPASYVGKGANKLKTGVQELLCVPKVDEIGSLTLVSSRGYDL